MSLTEDRRHLHKQARAEAASRAVGEMTSIEKENSKQSGAASWSSTSEDGGNGEEGLSRQRLLKEKRARYCFELVARGRNDGLGELYDLVAADLYGYLRAFLGSSEDAEDVFQEVFAKLAARGGKLIRVRKPLPYLFTIARNEALTLREKRGRRPARSNLAVLLESAAAPPDREPALSAREASAAIAELPDEQREAVVLKIYEGLTFAEIGEVTGVSINTAASRYRYGLARLSEKLKAHRGARSDSGNRGKT